MVFDGLRAYLQLASGLTEVTRKRATAAARAVVAQGEAGVEAVVPPETRAQVGVLAEDLVATSKANRSLLLSLVRVEVERTVNRLGLVSAAQLEAATNRARSLDDRVQELERQLRSARSAASPQPPAQSAHRHRGTTRSGASRSGEQQPATGGAATKKKAAGSAQVQRPATKKAATKAAGASRDGASRTAAKAGTTSPRAAAKRGTKQSASGSARRSGT